MAQVKHTGAKATDKQLNAIAAMAKRKGYRHTDDAVKAVIGKRPINGLNRERASQVIDALK